MTEVPTGRRKIESGDQALKGSDYVMPGADRVSRQETGPVRPGAAQTVPAPSRVPSQASSSTGSSVEAGGVRVVKAGDLPAGFEPREGDVLVVSYPEVTIPLKVNYASVKIGGWIYTSRLAAGDDVREQARLIYDYLRAHAEHFGAEKVRDFAAEFASGNLPQPTSKK